MINVSTHTVKNDLCVSCCACYAVCPTKAITINYQDGLFLPVIDCKCIDCGLCLKVCPSYEIELEEKTDDFFRGNTKECYVAYALDKTIRLNSASGGVITQIIIYLLESGLYEKACVLNYNLSNGSQAKLSVLNDQNEIFRAAKSKYIPASIENIINEININPHAKLIIVGTPCQFLSIRSYLKLKKNLGENILFLGLFCEKTLNYNIYNYYHFKYGNFDTFDFKSKLNEGWPGNTRICYDGKNKFIDKSVRMSLKPYFQLNRCRYCFDILNRYADISFGDCYIQGEESFEGKSNIIIRTKKGEIAFDYCKDLFDFKPVDIDKILNSQSIEKSKLNLVRAINNNSPIYKNYPKDIDSSLNFDSELDCKEYQQLRLGAKANSKKDYKHIEMLINPPVSLLNKTKRHIKKLIKIVNG